MERWLKAPVRYEEGTVEARDRGAPQGGVLSPLLANLFLHYAFDKWMQRIRPDNPFERYITANSTNRSWLPFSGTSTTRSGDRPGGNSNG
jgi:retron-type reverse transcriptase